MTPEQFFTLANVELQRAQLNYPPFKSMHEAYAVLLEELDELWNYTKQKPSRRNPDEIQRELIQIAAMAARAATELTMTDQ